MCLLSNIELANRASLSVIKHTNQVSMQIAGVWTHEGVYVCLPVMVNPSKGIVTFFIWNQKCQLIPFQLLGLGNGVFCPTYYITCGKSQVLKDCFFVLFCFLFLSPSKG